MRPCALQRLSLLDLDPQRVPTIKKVFMPEDLMKRFEVAEDSRYALPTYFDSVPIVLLQRGWALGREFCRLNALVMPSLLGYTREEWRFGVCAYYRPATVHVCLAYCAKIPHATCTRGWSWPGTTTDRTPYGVIAHELGHHVDYHRSVYRDRYYGDFSRLMRQSTEEYPISGYCDNDAEWFAEMFRVYLTNAALLKLLRPKSYNYFKKECLVSPTDNDEHVKNVGINAYPRILTNMEKKIQQAKVKRFKTES